MNIAIALTLSRILAIPFVFWLWLSNRPFWALSLLAAALLTDYFDGKVARALSQVTVRGAILDPVADKANVIAYYTYLYADAALPWWVYLPTMARNLSQLAAIPVLSTWLKIPFNVKPKRLPKWATATSFGISFAGFCLHACGTDALLPAYLAACALSAVMELAILWAFLPRFFLIATRRHDTFE